MLFMQIVITSVLATGALALGYLVVADVILRRRRARG